MYNTKLTSEQKADRKEMRVELLANGGALFAFAGFTVALAPVFSGSNMANFAVSVAAPDESKQRRKVGEYHALVKLFEGTCTQIPCQPANYREFAENVAETLGYDSSTEKGFYD